jgi:Ni,Fe-hydrogenase III small subunit/ferredoxin
MPWVTRGLRDGIVTTRYPARPDDYGEGWRGRVAVTADGPADTEVEAVCPTGAIQSSPLRLDGGRCILCGRCARERPDLFRFEPAVETATLRRETLIVPQAADDVEALSRLRGDLAQRVRSLRRSVHIRHVDAGSDGSDEWEVAALTNPIYDVQRLGIFFTPTPRHADILLVTGAGARGMRAPLLRTFEAMPEPRVVMAVGTDAVNGGLISPTYATSGGISGWIPIDVWVPGSPASPFSILHGILLALAQVATKR